MSRVPIERAEGSKRVLIFNSKLEKTSSGRFVSGLVVIHYGSWSAEVQRDIKGALSPGKYRLVFQKMIGTRWAHVSSEEICLLDNPAGNDVG